MLPNLKILVSILSIAMLSACVAAPKKVEAPVPVAPTYEQLMTDAETSMTSGQKDAAITSLEKAARTNPSRKEPWTRIAQINFDASNYSKAMVAAEEALQRDPTDLPAKSILAVGGLRVSSKAIADLRQGQALNGDVRNQAETLAQTLRESLGQSVLMPAPAPVYVEEAKPVVRKPAPKPVVKKPPTSASGTAPADTSSSTDPFGKLK
ncbi:MAG: motif [Pseudomonadota bacterium]|jgi:Tetratricopeptide repeat